MPSSPENNTIDFTSTPVEDAKNTESPAVHAAKLEAQEAIYR
jgi:hypothetical protein